MEKVKSIKFNLIMNSILTASNIIFPLISFPYISRILGPAGMGKVSFAVAVITYFTMFAQLGIPTYGIRACAKVRDDKNALSRTVQEIMIINLVVCVIVYVAFFTLLFIIPRFHEDRLLYIILSFTILFNAIGVDWLYKSLERYSYITIRSIIFKFIALLAMFLLVNDKADYIIYGGISIFASVGSNIFNFINLKKLIIIKPLKKYHFKKHLKYIAVFFAMSVATTVYGYLDTVMLGFMKTDVDIGYYSTAIKIKILLVNFVASLGTVLLPRVSYYIENNLKKEFQAITIKSLNFVFIVATPLMVYFMIFAEPSITLLAGKEYQNSVIPMIIIMPTLLFIGLTNILGIQILVPLGKEKLVLVSVVAGAVVDVIINILLIPKFSSTGAAFGTVAAEFVVFLIQLYFLRREVISIFKQIEYWKIVSAVFIASIATCWLNNLSFNSFFILLISAILFFGIYLLVLNIFKEAFVTGLEKQLYNQFRSKLIKK